MRAIIGKTVIVALFGLIAVGAASAQDVVHDAEYYILDAQTASDGRRKT